MGYGTIDRGTYDKLVAAYREMPGRCVLVARSIHVDSKTARRGWLTGWPQNGWRPIKEIVLEEQTAARAALANLDGIRAEARSQALLEAAMEMERVKLAERASARKDVVESRAEEGQAVKAARRNALALLVATSHMIRACVEMRAKIEVAAREATPTIKQASILLERTSRLAKNATETARAAMEMERLHLGEPTAILGVQAQVVEMTLDEAERRVRSAQTAIERARVRGLAPALPASTVEVVGGGDGGTGTGDV